MKKINILGVTLLFLFSSVSLMATEINENGATAPTETKVPTQVEQQQLRQMIQIKIMQGQPLSDAEEAQVKRDSKQ